MLRIDLCVVSGVLSHGTSILPAQTNVEMRVCGREVREAGSGSIVSLVSWFCVDGAARFPVRGAYLPADMWAHSQTQYVRASIRVVRWPRQQQRQRQQCVPVADTTQHSAPCGLRAGFSSLLLIHGTKVVARVERIVRVVPCVTESTTASAEEHVRAGSAKRVVAVGDEAVVDLHLKRPLCVETVHVWPRNARFVMLEQGAVVVHGVVTCATTLHTSGTLTKKAL